MKAKLFELDMPDSRVREITLQNDEFLIGRGDDCDLCIRDPEVSRHHVLIRQRAHEVMISDLGSSNGTFVNGNRLLSQIRLATGDEIQLGPCRFVIDLGDQPDFKVPQQRAIDSTAQTFTARDLRSFGRE